MFMIKLAGFAALISMFSSPAVASIFGTYWGTLEHNRREMRQNAKLELVSHRNEDNSLQIVGILSLYFGGFDSSEYTSYHFDDVTYNLLSGQIVLSQADQDLTIRSSQFGGGTITAKVRSGVGGNIGALSLSRTRVQMPSASAIMKELGGTYVGNVNNRRSVMNLQTYRNTSDTVRIGNPFGAYKIKGQMAAVIPTLCPTNPSQPCVTNQIENGSYNFFNGELVLFGSHRTESCAVEANGDISCEGGRYRKINSQRRAQWQVPKSKPFGIAPSSTRTSFLREGLYTGYLYHEKRDMYQPASLDVLSYQNQGENQFLISSIASLYFGDFNGSEILSYRFEDQKVNVLTGQMVIERTEDDVDALLKITSFDSNTVIGDWYSIIHGKVGTFRMQRNSTPQLPDGAIVMDEVEGSFASLSLKLDLDTRLGQTPVNTENPFFPLTFSGYFAYQGRTTSRLMISGGSYDFYTGKIGLEIADGARVATGIIGRSNSIKLQWMSKGFATLMQDPGLRSFSRGSI